MSGATLNAGTTGGTGFVEREAAVHFAISMFTHGVVCVYVFLSGESGQGIDTSTTARTFGQRGITATDIGSTQTKTMQTFAAFEVGTTGSIERQFALDQVATRRWQWGLPHAYPMTTLVGVVEIGDTSRYMLWIQRDSSDFQGNGEIAFTLLGDQISQIFFATTLGFALGWQGVKPGTEGFGQRMHLILRVVVDRINGTRLSSSGVHPLFLQTFGLLQSLMGRRSGFATGWVFGSRSRL